MAKLDFSKKKIVAGNCYHTVIIAYSLLESKQNDAPLQSIELSQSIAHCFIIATVVLIIA